MLQRALDRDGGYTPLDVFQEVVPGNFQMWIAGDYLSVTVTRVQVFPRYKALQICWTAGDEMDEWLDPLLDVLETYAQDLGCREVEAYGRPGWKKAVAHRGYEQTMIVVRKLVDE